MKSSVPGSSKMREINHQIGGRGGLENAFRAFSEVENIPKWWSERAEGKSGPGSVFEVFFGKSRTQIQVLDQDPGRRLWWKILSGAADWVGTEITVDFEEEEGQVLVNFRHSGFKPTA